MTGYLPLTLRLAAFVVAVVTWNMAAPTAQADGQACNPAGASEAKWIALTKGDASCSGTTRRQQSWFLVQPGQCVTMFTHSAAGRQYWYHTQGANSGVLFPSSGNVWKERYDTGFGGLDAGTCFDIAQGFNCFNPGAVCANRNHFFLGTVSGTRLSIGL